MPKRNESRHDTAFTVSIEAREGVTTGISAADRSRTILTAIDPTKGAADIVSPGHVFPLIARDGGVLVRTGHTEASIDLARLAGLNPSAVICEIMNDDGTMARMPDLVSFAQRHGLKVASIADLIAYRLRHDKIVKRTLEGEINSRFGGRFKMYVYVNTVEYAEHIVLVKGDVAGEEPVLVRVHDFNPLDDVLGDLDSGREGKLQAAMRMIDERGKGVVVLIREPRQNRVTELVRNRLAGAEHAGLRDYGIGAQILLDLGVRNMVLLHNTQWTIVGLEGYGLKVVGQQPIQHSEWGLG
jgi:3,4-dihydroxy 2-butanone 4-phosphate synthase/GTP cyclohydrolase II